jgi:hypothetical protein
MSSQAGKAREFQAWLRDLRALRIREYASKTAIASSGSSSSSSSTASSSTASGSSSGSSSPGVEIPKDEVKVTVVPIPTSAHPSPHVHTVTAPLPLCCIMRFESLISYPFVLSTAVKADVLEMDAQWQMRVGGEAELARARASGSQFVMPYLVLNIRRSHLVQDAIDALSVYSMPEAGTTSSSSSRGGLGESDELMQAGITEFKKPLKVSQ